MDVREESTLVEEADEEVEEKDILRKTNYKVDYLYGQSLATYIKCDLAKWRCPSPLLYSTWWGNIAGAAPSNS